MKLLLLILRNTEWKRRGSMVELSLFEVRRRVSKAERGRYEDHGMDVVGEVRQAGLGIVA